MELWMRHSSSASSPYRILRPWWCSLGRAFAFDEVVLSVSTVEEMIVGTIQLYMLPGMDHRESMLLDV
ncbi:hypothetical protein NEOLEDRAFT_1138156 [Neolentinus lepideus HHB14362 ss-1]|uniref:Uncharacterized protein n=1 Tax=Neolentinus lepideus HHB14362 ss-1 TaxID=1314782 RepID=A0A165QD83_9AGAM|nr:hypothetical protein NEOLEDRAFT_1138156 [Neolentinus lepideus HHB14362 ss-1]